MKVKDILIIFFNGLVLVTLFYYLFVGKLDAIGVGFIMISAAVSSVLFYNIKYFQKIRAKFGEQEFQAEMKQVRDDIYAKIETVKNMGEVVADITAFNITRVGRFATPDIEEKMLEARDKIENFLQELGSDRQKIDKIISQIDNMIIFDLKNNLKREIGEIANQRQKNGKQIDRGKINKEVGSFLENYTLNGSRSSLIEYLKSHGLYDPSIVPFIDQLDKFLKDKTL